jgi:hypothetical protein
MQNKMPSSVSGAEAEDALNKIWNIFQIEENKKRLVALVTECEAISDPQQKLLVRHTI